MIREQELVSTFHTRTVLSGEAVMATSCQSSKGQTIRSNTTHPDAKKKTHSSRMVNDSRNFLGVAFEDGHYLFRLLVEHNSILVRSTYKEKKDNGKAYKSICLHPKENPPVMVRVESRDISSARIPGTLALCNPCIDPRQCFQTQPGNPAPTPSSLPGVIQAACSWQWPQLEPILRELSYHASSSQQ